MLHFRVQFDSEFSLDRCDDALFQSDNLLRIRLTCMVYDHQRLLVPYGRSATALSLPSALLDHPCGRDLDEWFW